MRCIVSSCGSNSDTSEITFHSFPTSPSVRAVWLKVLNREASELTEDSAVCSEHFLKGDLYVNRNGMTKVRGGALPIVNIQTVPLIEASDVEICRICFARDCKLYKMSTSNKLLEAYTILTGLWIQSDDPLPPYLCPECALRLLNCMRFRTRSIHAHSILQEVVKKYDCIQFDSVMSVIGDEGQVGSILQIRRTEQYDFNGVEINNDTDEVVLVPDTFISVKVERVEGTDDINDNEKAVDEQADNTHDLFENDIKIDANDLNSRNSADDLSNCSIDAVEDLDPKAKEKDRLIESCVSEDQINSYTVKDEVEIEEVEISMAETVRDDGALNTEERQVIEEETASGGFDKSGRHPKRRGSRIAADKLITRVVATRPKQMRPLDELIKTNIVKLRKRVAGDEPVPTFNKFYRKVTHRTVDDVPLWSRMNTDTIAKTFTCHLCNYKTGYKKDLKLHLKIHCDDKDQRTTKSIVCKKSIDKSKCNNAHSDGDMFSCDASKQVFSDKDNFSRDIEQTSGGKPHACDDCKKRFKHNFEMQKQKTHSGDKPYTCNVCKKTFNFVTSLTLHARAFHQNDRRKKKRRIKDSR